ncbi:phosphonate C-P lyase system protein PhnH [Phyllobacterium sophorae]|uniref:Phosphonate C-P lyase system protein PhnH n=1 Tax=Phyllobacterium sophorae TaxID=1520277 RepID=A0A2P7B2X8_9HYPH|nr:phosphonate C-P lyase system protein PhnH [Phyllobacterium sophorae]PSH60815.1 phosphonate C-P lyase system protein PhnH [Phyllobacterium sophorae]
MTVRSDTSFRSAVSTDAPLKPGFADPVFDSQAVFRDLLVATAYPGRIVSLDRKLTAPRPFSSATAALCLSLMDFETPAWLDTGLDNNELTAWLRFHCSLPLTKTAANARFAIVSDPANLPPLQAFHQGDVEYPDRSTTLIIQVPSLADGPAMTWMGPGINGSIKVGIAGLPPQFWTDWDLNRELYPRGIDVFFTSGNDLIGLPRTIKVEA